MNETIKALKLTNGQDVIAFVHEEENKVVITNPVVYKSQYFQKPDGGLVENILFGPFVSVSEQKTFALKPDDVLLSVEVRKMVQEHYKRAVGQMNDAGEEIFFGEGEEEDEEPTVEESLSEAVDLLDEIIGDIKKKTIH
jgi:hypothetical protein